MGNNDDGGSVSAGTQRADAKKVLQLVHKKTLGGRQRVCVGWRENSHAEQGDKPKDQDQLRRGAACHDTWLPSKEEEVREETERVPKGNPFAALAAESD